MDKFGKQDDTTPVEKEEIHKIRITLASTDVQALQKASESLTQEAKKQKLRVKGPIPLPTRKMRITTRKAPNGEGTNTWDKFEMRVHKRLIDMQSSNSAVKSLMSIGLEPNVQISVIVR